VQIFVVGEHFAVTRRPSIRNLHADEMAPTILFDSSRISKEDSASDLNEVAQLILVTQTAQPTRYNRPRHYLQLRRRSTKTRWHAWSPR
jgi:hypothetical protein